MTNSFRKLLLVLVTLLLGVMSGGVRAQTSYDFSAIFENGDRLSGTFTNDGTGGPYYPFQTVSNFTYNGTLVPSSNLRAGRFTDYGGNPYGLMFNSPGPTSQAYTPPQAIFHVQFDSQTLYGGLVYSPVYMSNNVPAYIFPSYISPITSYNNATYMEFSQNGTAVASAGTIEIGSAGVPEIDGALAPKVGFLLACLFLMFGRKRQDLAPALTA